ncbi:uncharacterized protein K444DRAFT_635422 [Hyaloscypha bicolor E]|uniref:Uncharacterized protein n=1 Tax=Hyaloscypha bicolor E TaxID=1095630 RepID=A0A2J6SRK4_9HELO|nr:uncharacterized protein K444DRAFT_635422 [Hyaloscypha bicolor E]PMD53392.1 hypothetical protein K444DRAFT_635422 [Hyaloscypha bicolor E]
MSRMRAESPQPITLQPILRTPSKRRRQDRGSDGDSKPVSGSPVKKARTPRRVPAIPSLEELDAANREQEKEWEAEWYAWVVCHLWRKDKNFRHPRGTHTIYWRNAMNSFSVKEGELDTLPYQELPNQYNRSNPIRSYKREDVRVLACRKHAMLAGLHKHGLSERELLRRGEILAKKRQLTRCEEHPDSKALVPPTPITSTPTSPSFPVPTTHPDTWQTPIWQGDRIVGSQTTIQSDPEEEEDICDYHEWEHQTHS